MTFEEVLDQAIAMLQRRGRLTYRTLKRQFQLDDEELEDLTFELITGQRLAVDEDGQVLVWVGAAPDTFPSDTEERSPAKKISSIEEGQVRPDAPDAERRHLTVMFSDLVDSTPLAELLDPEELRDVVAAYQEMCARAVSRFDGYIARYMGDGILVYFGYPSAHEDDAIRAIHAGLAIVEGVRQLNSSFQQKHDFALRVRVGIHSGLVVAGEMGAGQPAAELAVVGETPNIAARVEGIAEANSVAITRATYNLAGGYFHCHSLGPLELKGVSQQIEIFQVVEQSGVQSRLDLAHIHGLTPLVGREQEVGLLIERWNQARDGQGQVVLLSGEGGIGKSRLVEALREQVEDQDYTRLECRSSAYYQNTALYPIAELFQRLLNLQAGDSPEQQLEKLKQGLSRYGLQMEQALPVFAHWLGVPIPEGAYQSQDVSSHRLRQMTLESILAILLELADERPLLLILEDLHWLDPTTTELLELLIDQAPTAAICVLLTCRPPYQPSWGSRSYTTEIRVNRLSRQQIEGMAERVAGSKSLPAEVKQRIVEQTDGVPLFVEEITKAVLESGVLREGEAEYHLQGTLSSLSVPNTLQDSLMARLDRLGDAKSLAQYASVIGRQFSFQLLSSVSRCDPQSLEQELSQLVGAELLYQRGLPPNSTYLFKHGLIQDTAYESLLKSTREQYHRRIAEVLSEEFPETAEAQPELLAHHFTAAGCFQQALLYWQRAGQAAREASAHLEAVAHLTTGLEILNHLAQTPERDKEELALLAALGNSLAVTKGWAAPEVEKAYARAGELHHLVGDSPQLLPALWGASQVHILRADMPKHKEIAEQLFALAKSNDDPVTRMAAHWVLGVNLFHVGDTAGGIEHIEDACRLYESGQHGQQMMLFGIDLGVFALCYMSHSLWILGYLDQAVQKSHEAISLARQLSHPFSNTVALAYAAMLSQFRRDDVMSLDYARETSQLCENYGYTYYRLLATIVEGWVELQTDFAETGINKIQEGIDALPATGTILRLPYYRALLAGAFLQSGQIKEGLLALENAFNDLEHTGEGWMEPELHRLKGELLLAESSNNLDEVEACYRQGLEISRRQQTKAWELRIAISLARLWASQGRGKQAYELLTSVFAWFTEGFETADLRETRLLLEELSQQISSGN